MKVVLGVPAALFLVVCALLALRPVSAQPRPRVVIGSKAFEESWVLGEALAMLARSTHTAEVEHRRNLGGTEVVYKALLKGDVDIYPDYTGTVAQVLMKAKGTPTRTQMREFLARQGIGMSDSLGFNDGYALAVMPETQRKYSLYRISDLAKHPDLRLRFTHEFIGRNDGWLGLSQAYGLHMTNVVGVQHQLAYESLSSGQIDVTEVYTTDAQIQRLGLKLLEDDRRFFPQYDAVLLYRLSLLRRARPAFDAMERLAGEIDQPRMIRANVMVTLEKKPVDDAARALLGNMLEMSSSELPHKTSVFAEIALETGQHLQLVAVSLLAAILIGIPLGVLAARSPLLANVTLAGTGVLQTIPSLALLAFLVPQFGVSVTTALIALFLYSLLPIVRNTYTGLTTIPPQLMEAADALGLPPLARLLRISLPMASPSIMAGIKTSAVINVGTATLAALIGAGGLGEPILRGIDLLDNNLILQGAVPAAVLALLVQWGFDLLDRVVIPRGLRLKEKAS